MEEVLLVKFGEVALKGQNRYIFENRLIAAIENNIKDIAGYFISREIGRYIVRAETGPFDYDLIVPKVASVLGLVSCCPCIRDFDKDIENINNLCLFHMQNKYPNKQGTFKIKATRSHKTYPLNSQELAAAVGKHILDNTEGLTVSLTNPDITLIVELRNYVYIYSEEIKGFGGLPVGSCGRAMALLSSGIDSPVACFLTAKRGCLVEAVYFDSPPYTSERALIKVKDICATLSAYTAIARLYVVNFTDIQLKIKEKTPQDKFTIMLKRSMMRVAERLAVKNNCDALITGDSIGQVASQTLKSLAAIDAAVTMPVIRPLSGLDKQEITQLAQKIKTYDISIRPFEDCCTIFIPKHPDTKPKISAIENFERRIQGLMELTDAAAENVTVYEY